MDEENNRYDAIEFTENILFEFTPYIHFLLFFPLLTVGLFVVIFLLSGPPIHVLIPGLALVSVFVFPIVTKLSLFYRYIGGIVVGKYIEKGRYPLSPWTYYVQVDNGRWVEDFYVQFGVFRLLSEGDIYLGVSSNKYDEEAYDVPDVMESRKFFEDLLALSMDPSVSEEPLVVTLVDTRVSRGSRRKRPTYYDHYDVKDNI